MRRPSRRVARLSIPRMVRAVKCQPGQGDSKVTGLPLPLGFAAIHPDNAGMDIKSDNPELGFQFPGTFELSAVGAAGKDLETELPRLLVAAGVEVLTENISWKHSSNGKYVSVRLGFRAANREQYDAAHQALRDHPEVKWTL